ncbi:MAG: hypothetical protein FJW37_08090 [Acidobacteria bacterium]|nr:hypothetical protein [Acidobacteriota bacterium]
MSNLKVISTATVRQQELETLLGLKNQIRHLKGLHKRRSQEILNRLLAGCAVERGPHMAAIEESANGPTRITRLQVS